MFIRLQYVFTNLRLIKIDMRTGGRKSGKLHRYSEGDPDVQLAAAAAVLEGASTGSLRQTM